MSKWKLKVNQPGNYWWQVGENKQNKLWLPEKWINVKEQTPTVKSLFPGDNWQVHAYDKINPATIDGHYKSFKTKEQAMSFARHFMRTH